jgi:NhaP-type Na+/H+ or K+/H+ antiporter
VAPAFDHLTWQSVVYALLSLTVIRMVPVAVSLAGTHLGWPTVSFVGWFGPRGLASVVFALLALEELGATAATPAVTVITITVLLSVIAHGVTAEPLAARYAAALARAAAGPAHAERPELPVRNLNRRRPGAAPDPGPGSPPP